MWYAVESFQNFLKRYPLSRATQFRAQGKISVKNEEEIVKCINQPRWDFVAFLSSYHEKAICSCNPAHQTEKLWIPILKSMVWPYSNSNQTVQFQRRTLFHVAIWAVFSSIISKKLVVTLKKSRWRRAAKQLDILFFNTFFSKGCGQGYNSRDWGGCISKDNVDEWLEDGDEEAAPKTQLTAPILFLMLIFHLLMTIWDSVVILINILFV